MATTADSKLIPLVQWVVAPLLLAVLPLLGQYLLGPPNILSSRALAVLSASLVIGYGLAMPQFYWRRPLFSRPEMWAFYIWVVFSIVAVGAAGHMVPALLRQTEWLIIVFAALALFSLSRMHQGLSLAILCAVPYAFLILGGKLLLDWYAMDNPQDFPWVTQPRPFWHIRHVSYFALAAFITSFIPLFHRDEGKSRIEVFLLAGFSLSFLFWGGGRGAILSALVCLVVLMLFARVNTRKTLLWLVPLVVVAAFFASSAHLVNDPNMGLTWNHNRDELSGVDGIAGGRIGVWTHALEHALKTPLTGLGPDGYIYVPGQPQDLFQPHSIIVQSIAEWGIVGGLAFLFLLVSIFLRSAWWIWRSRAAGTEELHQPFGLLLFLSLSLLGLIDGTYYHGWSLLLLAVGFSAMVSVLPGRDVTLGWSTVDVRRPVIILGLLFLLVHGFQVLITSFIMSPDIPPPQSLKARMVMAWPSSPYFPRRWYNSWRTKYPREAFDFMRKQQLESPQGWYFYLAEADLMRDIGAPEVANKLVNIALEKMPENIRDDVRAKVTPQKTQP